MMDTSLEGIRSLIQREECMSIFANRAAENERKRQEDSPRSRSQYRMLISTEDRGSPKTSRPDRKHVCGVKCRQITISFSLYVTSERAIHMCVDGSCSDPPEKHLEMLSDANTVYVCDKGWTSHMCDDLCSYVLDIRRNGGLITEKGFKCPVSGKTMFRKNGCSLTDREKKKYLDEAVEVWKNKLSGGFLSVDPSLHTCDTSAEPIPGGINASQDPFMTEEERLFKGMNLSKRKLSVDDIALNGGCELERIESRVFESSTGERHLCMRGLCPSHGDRNYHWVEAYNISHLYVCKRTGIPHFCGEICQRKMLTKDGMYVCPLTGYVDPVPVARDAMYSGEQRLKSDVDARRLQPDVVRMDIDDIDGVVQGMTVRRSSNKKEEYMLLAVSKIASVFSRDQMDAEETIMREGIEKEISAQMTRYVNKTTQNKRILVAPEMFLLIHNHRKKKDFSVKMTLSADDRKHLSIYYAERCLKLWYIVRTRTKRGRESQTTFGFKDFILPALSIIQDGFTVSENDIGYEAVVIKPDSLLDARCLQNAHRLSGRMDSPSQGRMCVSEWIGKKKGQQDKIRYAIEEALLEAIRSERVSPEVLSIDSVDFDSISMDEVLGAGKIRTPENLRKKHRG